MFARNHTIEVGGEKAPQLVGTWCELLESTSHKLNSRDRKLLEGYYGRQESIQITYRGEIKGNRKYETRGPRERNAVRKLGSAIRKTVGNSISAGVFVDGRQLENETFESKLLAPVKGAINYPLFLNFSVDGKPRKMHNAKNASVKDYLDSRANVFSTMVSELHTYDTNRKFLDAGAIAVATAAAACVASVFTKNRAVIQGIGNAVSDLPQDVMNGLGGLRSPDKNVKRAAVPQLLLGYLTAPAGYFLPVISPSSEGAVYGAALGIGAGTSTLFDSAVLAYYFYRDARGSKYSRLRESLKNVWDLPSYRGQIVGSGLQLIGAISPRVFGYNPDPVIESAYLSPLDTVCATRSSQIQHHRQGKQIKQKLLEGLYR